jgi:hypothetical protein
MYPNGIDFSRNDLGVLEEHLQNVLEHTQSLQNVLKFAMIGH